MATNVKLLEGKPYVTPEYLSGQIQEQVRCKKEDDCELRAKIAFEVRDEFPDASMETLNAIVTRRIYE